MNLIKILVSLFVSLPVLITLSLFVRNPPRDRINAFADARTLQIPSPNPNSSSSAVCERSPSSNFEENGLYRPMAPAQMTKEDELHGGLVAPGFDEGSCLSRYESSLYRKISPHKPSSYLLSSLGSYEDLHKQCGPHNNSYKSSLKQLKKKSNGKSSTSTTQEYCRYVVWIANNGLGNKMLTIAAAFLYALLTNRVLLLDPGKC